MVATSPAGVASFVGDWFWVNTKPQGEARMERELEGEGVQVFVPRVRMAKTYTRRNGTQCTKKWDRIAWPCYLFVCGDLGTVDTVRDSMWNVSVRKIHDRERMVNFLAGYEQEFKRQCTPETRGLKVRDVVNFIAGPLQSVQIRGVVTRIEGRRVWVDTLLFGEMREIEIEDLSHIERAA